MLECFLSYEPGCSGEASVVYGGLLLCRAHDPRTPEERTLADLRAELASLKAELAAAEEERDRLWGGSTPICFQVDLTPWDSENLCGVAMTASLTYDWDRVTCPHCLRAELKGRPSRESRMRLVRKLLGQRKALSDMNAAFVKLKAWNHELRNQLEAASRDAGIDEAMMIHQIRHTRDVRANRDKYKALLAKAIEALRPFAHAPEVFGGLGGASIWTDREDCEEARTVVAEYDASRCVCAETPTRNCPEHGNSSDSDPA